MAKVIEGPWGPKNNGRVLEDQDKVAPVPDDANFRTHRANMWVRLANVRAKQQRSAAKIFEDRALRRDEREKEDDPLLRGRIIAGESKWSARPAYYEMIDKLLDERRLKEVNKIRPRHVKKKEEYKINADRIIKGILPAVGNPEYPQYTKEGLGSAKHLILEVDDDNQSFTGRLEKILDDRFDEPDPIKRLRLLAAAMLYRNIYFDSFGHD